MVNFYNGHMVQLGNEFFSQKAVKFHAALVCDKSLTLILNAMLYTHEISI